MENRVFSIASWRILWNVPLLTKSLLIFYGGFIYGGFNYLSICTLISSYFVIFACLFLMGPKSKTTSVQPETHVELKKEWGQTLPLIYDEDSVLDRNEVEIWVRSFNSSIKIDGEEDYYDLYMQNLFVLFCVLSLYGIQALRDDLTETNDRWQVHFFLLLFV